MKLVLVFMLTALPLSCYAGSGCKTNEVLVNETIDSTVSQDQFIQDFLQLIPGAITENTLRKFKQCFLDQSEDTLSNVSEMMNTIYKSEQCASY